ncbi:unnamed protein product [Pedinophyceae sp. YPF-701]|nr:unnamed protein product [Pedinophyceae sp. YPF-701]
MSVKRWWCILRLQGFDDFGDTLERERGGDRGSYGDDGGFRGGRPGADRARGRGRGGHERDRGEFRRGGDYDDGDSGPQWRTRRELRGGGPAPILADLSGEVVWGVSPVIAAMRSGRRELYKLFVQDGLGSGQGRRRDRSALQAALAAAEERGVPVDYVSKHDLNLLSDNRPHQGLAIDASPIEPTNLETPPPAERAAGATRAPVWVALDEVTDPQNLGAVLRSAHFLGVDGVVICAKNSAPLSPVVSKASAGALEVMPVHAVGNLMRWLHRCQEEGWEVLGAEAGEDSVDIREVSVESPTVLVLGSEGFGLRPLVRRACSAFVRIDGGVEASGESVEGFEVDSLNVSVAAGIAMHHLTRG